MDRITLSLLEVTNGALPPALLPLVKGLNVISGAENRGKSYAFGCLDYLLGASEPPDANPHSNGYSLVTLYFTVNDTSRGVLRRYLTSGDAAHLPLHPLDEDVPTLGWQPPTKKHGSKSESLSSYWLAASGFERGLSLRRTMSGDVSAFTARVLSHLVLVDELRIMEKRSPALSQHKTANPADIDALALVLGARRNPPRSPAEPSADGAPIPGMSAEVREFIEREVERLDALVATATLAAESSEDEAAVMAREVAAFTAAADEVTRDLEKILSEIEEAQQQVAVARGQTKSSREITARLELLQRYYESDLKRLEAISETAFLLAQLSPVPCPTCDSPLAGATTPNDGLSEEYLAEIQAGAKAEAAKIHHLGGDLKETLERTRGEARESASNEREWTETLSRLRAAERDQARRVTLVHARLNETFAALGQLAQRQALKQQRAELVARLAEGIGEPVRASATVRTDFDPDVVKEFCRRVRDLLTAWGWMYTTGPVEVVFDLAATDIVISGAARRSFGKAVRALATSAFVLAVMDHCFARGLPHPGFVVLDSPLTTKKENAGTTENNEPVADEIVSAFFTHLAANYSDRQVIIIDNKEPPAALAGRFNHIRFEDDERATRRGFFP